MLKKIGNCVAVSSLLLLTACFGGGGGGGSSSGGNGGSGGGSGSTSNHLPSSLGTINGVFLDSAIVGINYSTGSTNAVTGAGGSFSCEAGQDVTFKLGSIVIGKAPCLPVITPIELATLGAVRASSVTFTGQLANQLSTEQNNHLQRLTMFLQTLDSDGNLANGISPHAGSEIILQQILTASDTTLEEALADGAVDSEYEDALAEFVNNSAPGHASVSVSDAISHLSSTLASQTACVVGDVSNSASVLGYAPNCIALTCDSGYTVVDGSCVATSAVTLATLIGVLDDYATSNVYRKNSNNQNVTPLAHVDNFVEYVVGYSSGNSACNPSMTVGNSTGQNLNGFWDTTDYEALSSDIMGESSGVKGRATNSFLTAPGVEYQAGRRCAEQVTTMFVKSGILSASQKAQLLNLIGANDDTGFSVSADGSGLSADELALLDLLIDYYDIQ